MRIGIERNAIGSQFIDLFQGAIKRFWALFGQAINQVDIDRFKTYFASRCHQGKDLLYGLNAVHCFLHFRVKILHAKTKAIEPQFKQQI